MKRRLVLALCLAGCTPTPRLFTPLRYEAAPATPDEPFRATPPSHVAVAEVADAPPQSWTLPNGLRVVLIERHGFPVVAARLQVDRGPLDLGDPAGLNVAQTVYLYARGGNDAAFEGLMSTAARTGTTYASGAYGGGIWSLVKGSPDWLDAALETLKRVSFGAGLAADEYDRRAREWSGVASAGGASVAQAERFILFGDRHAFGYAGRGREVLPMATATTIHDRLLQPGQAILVVVGDVAREALEASVQRAFGAWAAGSSLPRRREAPPARSGPRVAVVSTRGLSQMRASVFARGPAPSSDDYFAFSLAARWLGGSPSSRLFEHLREETGAAYSVGGFTYMECTASWMSIAASYDMDKAVDGVGSVLGAVRDLRAGKVTDEDLAVARESLLAGFRDAMSTAEVATGAYAYSIAEGLGVERVRDLPGRLASVRREDVIRVANLYLTDQALHVLFIGDDRWLYPGSLGMGGPTVIELPK